MAKVPKSWIDVRVRKAEQRLTATAAGTIVWNAMKAHGGLKTWYENGPLSFHFNYQPLDGDTPRNTLQAVDTWNSRARHFQYGDSTSQFGWDGEKAWTMAKDSTVFNYNTRFWALTPYFFVAQPFVLDGKGTNLELLSQIVYQGRPHHVIKVTFDAGTGDAPDDYYVLYFSTENHELKVIRYIVSYPGYFEKGKHLPEKLMELQGRQIVDGIQFPTAFKTHWLTEEEKAGEHITDITLNEVAFLPKLEDAFFDPPEASSIKKDF